MRRIGWGKSSAEALRQKAIRAGRKRVERLMGGGGAVSGLFKRPRGKTTIRVHGVRTAPDLA